MKKVLFIFTIALIGTNFTACDSFSVPEYDVTVVAKQNSLVDNMMLTNPVVTVTAGGDTIITQCEDSLTLNHSFPFKGKMRKGQQQRYGYVYTSQLGSK